jgi:transposase-like protein
MDTPSPVIDLEIDLFASLLRSLSPERRRELVNSAVRSRFVDLLDNHQMKTVGEFFRAVEVEPHWPLFKQLLLSDIVSTRAEEAAEEGVVGRGSARSSSPTDGDSLADAHGMHMALIGASRAGTRLSRVPAGQRTGAKAETLNRAELVSSLQKHGGNISAVARELGKERVQIRRWVKRFGLTSAVAGGTAPAPSLALLPAEPETPAAAGKAAKRPRTKRTGDILDDIVTLVGTQPGLRTEEIQKRLDRPMVLIKSTLAVLRKQNRVRTEGTRRGTRYFAAA